MIKLQSAKSFIAMRILLNRFHNKNSKEFLKILPEEVSKEILSTDVTTSEIDPVFVKTETFFKNIHFSWIKPHLLKYPIFIQKMMLSALPKEVAIHLKNDLKLDYNIKKLNKFSSFYFLKMLYKDISENDILDISFLPKEPLFSLLDLKKTEIVSLIDYLGLYDLADEIRHIVENNTLKTVYACLDNKQMQFLKICLHQKSKFVTQKLDLKKWDGDCKKLKFMLHQRGLYRLGKALCGTNKNFYWNFTRKIDTGRSAILNKYYFTSSSPGLTSLLAGQVLNVINFLKQKSEL